METLSQYSAVSRLHRFKTRLRAPRIVKTTTELSPFESVLKDFIANQLHLTKEQARLQRDANARFSRDAASQRVLLERSVEAAETLAQVMLDIRSVVPGLSYPPGSDLDSSEED